MGHYPIKKTTEPKEQPAQTKRYILSPEEHEEFLRKYGPPGNHPPRLNHDTQAERDADCFLKRGKLHMPY